MKKLLVLFIIPFLSMGQGDLQKIKEVLYKQEGAWNQGNLYEFMLGYGFFDKANKYVNAYNTLTENSDPIYVELEKDVRKFNNNFILIKKDYDDASNEESLN